MPEIEFYSCFHLGLDYQWMTTKKWSIYRWWFTPCEKCQEKERKKV